MRSLAARGYLETGMQDIAKLANVTLARVYHHFPTRDLLVETVIDRCVDVVAENYREENAAVAPSPQEQVRTALESMWRIARWQSTELRVLMDLATQVPRNESLRAAVVRAFDTLADEVVLQIGPTDPADAGRALSHVLVSTLHGLVILDGYIGSRSGGAGESRILAQECVARSLFGSCERLRAEVVEDEDVNTCRARSELPRI